jgi:hypothetical protein
MVLGLLAGCAPKPNPPRFTVVTDPADGQVVSGRAVSFSCNRGLDREPVEYVTKLDSDCPMKQLESSGCLAKYEVEQDCLGGKGVYTVTAKGKGGTTIVSKDFTLVRALASHEVLPDRPDPLPGTWKLVDTFDGTVEKKANLWEGFIGTWTFKSGSCQVAPGPEKTLKLSYKLPIGSSQCGFFEYLKGGEGKSEAVDVSGYTGLTFQLRSADERVHKLRLEVVQWDKLAEYNQGPVFTGKEALVAKPYWRRYEYKLTELPQGFDLKAIKSIGLTLDGRDGFGQDGTVLVDNLAFIQ